jgi:limonene-1,2-epoxide hydrolase
VTAGQAAPAGRAGSASGNDALIREFLAAWERRDTDFIVGCFADDGVYHSVPLVPIVGKEAIREFVAGFASVPPGHLEIRHQVASATVVLNERTDHLTMNGRPVTLPICGVFEIEAGRIKAWREYFDLGPVRAAYQES